VIVVEWFRQLGRALHNVARLSRRNPIWAITVLTLSPIALIRHLFGVAMLFLIVGLVLGLGMPLHPFPRFPTHGPGSRPLGFRVRRHEGVAGEPVPRPAPDRIAAYARWLRLMIAQALTDLSRGAALARPVLFLLDEFAALGCLDPVERAMGLMAGYGVQHVGRPLLTPDEVRTLRPDLQLLFLAGQRPIVATKLVYDADREFAGRFDPVRRV